MVPGLLEEEGEQRPSAQTVCGALRREANWKCLLLSLLIYTCLAAVTWCRVAEVTKVVINFASYPITRQRVVSPCEAGYLYIPVCFLALLYLVYLAECWHCTAQLSLQGHAQDLAEVLRSVQQMRSAEPIVWWKAVCYHYVRRKRQVTRYRHGEGYTATQVYYERVNSHAAASEFSSGTCGVRDISRELVLDPPTPVTRIRFSKGFAFSNLEAAAEFEEQRSRFFSEHERYDDYMEMREGLDLRGVLQFRELVVAYPDAKRKPWYCRPPVFWVASLLLLSWPMRLLQEYNTAYVHYQVTKLYGVNYDAPTEGAGLSRGTTLDSGDWDCCIRENCAIVPSYSEALLMESGQREEDENENEDEHRSLVGPAVSVASDARSRPSMSEDRESLDVRLEGHGAPVSQEYQQVSHHKRRSWGGILSASCSQGVGAELSRSSSACTRQLFFSSPLVERCPGDPFQGRVSTTPTEDPPPPYDEALGLPTAWSVAWPSLGLSRLRRSLTDRGDMLRSLGQEQSLGLLTQSPGPPGDPREPREPREPRDVRRCSETAARTGRACISMETSL